MRVAAVLSPMADPVAVLDAARAADVAGLDAVGLWDHYHSLRPEWAYVAGWSALGAIGAATSRIRIVPMVLNLPHYQLGVLAKEAATLGALTSGRFDVALGAGDWPESFSAWGESFAPAAERLDRLVEVVAALRSLLRGEAVTTSGRHVTLTDARIAPVPARPPRIIVGVGGSRRSLERAVAIADEVNVYTELLAEARARVGDSGRDLAVSSYVGWDWDQWPGDIDDRLDAIAAAGADRLFVSVGSANPRDRIEQLASWSRARRSTA